MFILVGARIFSLTFYGVNGHVWVEHLLTSLPGGQVGFLIFVNILVFLLAFFLDFFELAFIIMPLLGPAAEKLGIDLIWFGVMLGVNMQTSFMHPPFGFALFYLRSVAPQEPYKDKVTGKMTDPVTTGQIYWGAVPFVVIQCIMVGPGDRLPADGDALQVATARSSIPARSRSSFRASAGRRDCRAGCLTCRRRRLRRRAAAGSRRAALRPDAAGIDASDHARPSVPSLPADLMPPPQTSAPPPAPQAAQRPPAPEPRSTRRPAPAAAPVDSQRQDRRPPAENSQQSRITIMPACCCHEPRHLTNSAVLSRIACGLYCSRRCSARSTRSSAISQRDHRLLRRYQRLACSAICSIWYGNNSNASSKRSGTCSPRMVHARRAPGR